MNNNNNNNNNKIKINITKTSGCSFKQESLGVFDYFMIIYDYL